ncbi:hypothetical protein EV138_2197 [Kribbella voronezhensis]|uniref:Uncharacterized protein n=1 Tax=Kribbella voronezhensis TaxID=2512212 RepID=A0A4R7T9M3_9ACTN|nr:hypothetical protein [Kribbella voronezhensis]TDU88651.1 hypothetical protein EV138_2197 [Kribbella voronezhensis]
MDWTKEARGRLLATAYVVGFVTWLIGVLWILYNQFTDGSTARMTVGFVLFAIGQALIVAVAFVFRRQFPVKSPFKLAWNHLALGLELPAAVRLLLAR